MMHDMTIALVRMSVALCSMALAVSADARSAREAWDVQVARTCPGAHVEWTPFSSYSDLQDAYLDTLPKAVSDRIVAVAQTGAARQCREAGPASQCYEFSMFEALGRTGQLVSFAKWTCLHVRCEEMAVCSAFPSPK
jgi:hypothetical protein